MAASSASVYKVKPVNPASDWQITRSEAVVKIRNRLFYHAVCFVSCGADDIFTHIILQHDVCIDLITLFQKILLVFLRSEALTCPPQSVVLTSDPKLRSLYLSSTVRKSYDIFHKKSTHFFHNQEVVTCLPRSVFFSFVFHIQ